MLISRALLGLLVGASFLWQSPAVAASLDPTFAGNGIRDIETTDFENLSPRAIVASSDGSIFIAGSQDTTHENTFVSILAAPYGSSEYITTIPSLASVPNVGSSIEAAGESQMLVGGVAVLSVDTCGGTLTYYSTVTRINSDASVDTTFGGSSTFPGTAFVQLTCAIAGGTFITLDAAKNIFVTSNDILTSKPPGILVSKLSKDGLPDFSFGTSGQTTLNASIPGYALVAVGTAPSIENALLVGAVQNGSDDFGSFEILKITAEGMPDITFGNAGVFSFALSDGISVCCIASATDGSAYFAGTDGLTAFLGRVTPTGRLDQRFGDHGLVHLQVGTQTAATALAVDAKNRAHVSLNSKNLSSGPSGIEVVHFNLDGTRNLAVGNNGFLEQSCGFFRCESTALTIDASGRALVSIASAEGTFVLREDEIVADGFD